MNNEITPKERNEWRENAVIVDVESRCFYEDTRTLRLLNGYEQMEAERNALADVLKEWVGCPVDEDYECPYGVVGDCFVGTIDCWTNWANKKTKETR